MQAPERLERAKELLDGGRPAQALSLLKAPVPPIFRPERDYLRAECLRGQGYFLRAAALYRRLLSRSSAADPAMKVESCLSLASVLRSLGEVVRARRVWRRGHGIVRAGKLAGYDERFALEDALIDRALGRYGQSLGKLAPLLSLFRRQGDRSAEGFVLWAMGGARRFSGDLAGSEKDFRASLSAFERAEDETGRAYALFGLGGVTRMRGDFKASRASYARAGRHLEGTQDVFGRAYAHCGLANALRQVGDFSRARAHYLLSHKLYRSLDDKVDLAYVDWGLGKVAIQTGKLAEAESRLRRALEAFKRYREQRGLVLSEGTLACVLHARGKTAEAEGLFARSLRRARAAGLHAHLEIFT